VTGRAPYALEFTEDPAEFLTIAGDHLAADPVLSTVVSTVTDRALADVEAGLPAPSYPRWWVTVRDREGGVVGVAMRTAPFAPYPMFVLPMPDAAAVALGVALAERGEDVRGVNGVLPAAEVLARELARSLGGTSAVHEHTRLWVLGDLVEPAPPPGRLRVATPEDLELCLSWFQDFEAAAAEQTGREARPEMAEHFERDDIATRIEDRRIWLWEDESGEVVHLTAFNAPSFGVARVGPVYTLREHRGRGYAGAAVAAVSRLLVEVGAQVCLFTDQANPTSNKVYARVGYVPVVDMANLVITTPAPA
jgi:RimJ/RimL family protein N-acetyltransferase